MRSKTEARRQRRTSNPPSAISKKSKPRNGLSTASFKLKPRGRERGLRVAPIDAEELAGVFLSR
jgi:hypothetical protein